MSKINKKPQSRYKRNLKYIREKNGIRLNSPFSRTRSYVSISRDIEANYTLVVIEDHIKKIKKQLLKKYNIPLSVKSVIIGRQHRDFIEDKLTAVVEYVAEYYHKGDLELTDITDTINK